MRRLGRKSDIQDGTLVAFACPCDCTTTCNTNTCNHCGTEGGQVSLQAVDMGRARTYSSIEAQNRIKSIM